MIFGKKFKNTNVRIATITHCLFFVLPIFLSGCFVANKVEVKTKKSAKQKNEFLPITVSNVEVLNHQVIIKGTNLESIRNFLIKDGGVSTTLQIESQTSDTIVAKAISNVTFAAGKMLDFVLSNADAASTFTVNFSLCDSILGGKGFNCQITPNDKEVLSYDAASGKWQPRAVNGLSYIGSYDASSGANPAIKPAGQYYIISVAGDIDAGATILGVGDWIVSNGTVWQKIDNSTAIISVHGRTGAVVGDEGDYSLTQLSDATITAPVNNQILKYNGTTWVNSDLSALGGGTVTSVSGTAPISVTNGTSTPAISISQATTTTNGYLSSADWNTFNNKQPTITAGTTAQYYRGDKSWQTLDTSVVPENTNLYFTNARALGVPLTGFATDTNAIVATDSILQAFGKAQGQINNLTAGGSNFLLKNAADTVTGQVTLHAATGALKIPTTPSGVDLTDAANVQYVNTYADNKVAKSGDTMSGDLQINTKIKLQDSGTNTVSIQAPTTITSSYVLKLPTALGTNNQVLTTDAAGNLSWTSPATSTAPNGSAGGDLSGSYPNPTISGLDAAKINTGVVSNAEFNYLDGVTSSIQTQLNAKLSSYTETDPGVTAFAKAALPTCGAGEVLKADGTSLSCVTDNSGAGSYSGGNNLVIVTNGSGALSDSTISTTELGHLSGVSSNIQTQLNAKQATISKTTVQDVSKLRIYGANATNYVELTATALTGNRSLIFPDSDGANGYVLSTNGSGTLSWIAIPSAPVSTVFGRNGAVVSANGDYTASQVTNVAAGSIAATEVQAAINELDTEKQSIATFAADVRAVVLTGLSTATNAVIAATDSVLDAFGKLQAQISANSTSISNKADQTNVAQTITAATVTGLTAPLVGADATNKTYVDAQIAGASNQWTLNSGNVYRTTGNVGIGTSAPGVIAGSDKYLSLGSLATNFSKTSLEILSGGNSPAGTDMGKLDFIFRSSIPSDVNVARISAQVGSNTTKSQLAFYTNNGSLGQRMTISEAGNVGIGTTSPSGKLHVVESILANLPIFERSGANTDDRWLSAVFLATKTTDMGDGFGSQIRFSIQDDAGVKNPIADIAAVRNGADNSGDIIFRPMIAGSSTERMRITKDGNVGIGTSVPDRKLSIDDNFKITDYDNSLPLTNTPSMTLKTGSAHTGSRFPIIEWLDSAGTRGMYIGWGTSGSYIDMRLENSNNLAITNGNVGIGTTNPTSKLEVSGTIHSTSGGIKFPDGTTQTTANGGNVQCAQTNGAGSNYLFCINLTTGRVVYSSSSVSYQWTQFASANQAGWTSFATGGPYIFTVQYNSSGSTNQALVTRLSDGAVTLCSGGGCSWTSWGAANAGVWPP